MANTREEADRWVESLRQARGFRELQVDSSSEAVQKVMFREEEARRP